MTETSQSVVIAASLAEVWERYFDPARWPEWVDGFGSVVSREGYPLEGGTLRWRSTGSGRGEVLETVLEHHPRRLHRVSFSDPQTEGELRTRFEIKGSETAVEQRLTYGLRGGGPFGWAADKLFIRGQQRGSMRRSLERLKRDVEQSASAQYTRP